MRILITRSNVAIGASNGGHGLCFVSVLEKLGKAEVRNMGMQSGVQEYVVGLDIPVHYQWRAVVVQVGEAMCSLDCYVVPANTHKKKKRTNKLFISWKHPKRNTKPFFAGKNGSKVGTLCPSRDSQTGLYCGAPRRGFRLACTRTPGGWCHGWSSSPGDALCCGRFS